MTGLGVERTPRAAYPDPFVPPAGVSSLMPPHIQGAERRTERRAGHTGSRWGLRALVVGGLVIGGLAGAAWLLTGAAAHAADRGPGPIGPLIGSLLDGDGDVTAPVTGLLQAADQPLETVLPAREHHAGRHRAERHLGRRHGDRPHGARPHSAPRSDIVAAVLDVPDRVLTWSAGTLDEVDHGGRSVDTALGSVDHILRVADGPLRFTGGSRLTQPYRQAPMTVPAHRHHRHHKHPIADQPIFDQPADDAGADDQVQAPAVTPRDVVVQADPVVREADPVVRKSSPATRVAPKQDGRRKHAPAVSVSSTHRHRTATPAVVRSAGQEYQPGGDGPAAPLQLHLGDVSGTPASGSGTSSAGGSAAFLPTAIFYRPMAGRLLPFATDVEARRHDAEAPTVSPD